jgi:hypothetical protein
MGWVYGQQLMPAGKYLLGILQVEGSVPFSRFYNRDTDYAALAKAVAAHDEYASDELDEDHVHIKIEFAAGQLETAGLVTFTPLATRLIDGDQDYMIALTEDGRAFLASGRDFGHRDMCL